MAGAAEASEGQPFGDVPATKKSLLGSFAEQASDSGYVSNQDRDTKPKQYNGR